MGFQADKKTCQNKGFHDDLSKLTSTMTLQPGKSKMMDEAKKALTWTGICPMFVIRVRNITRVQDKKKHMSKAIGTHAAKEQRDAVVQGTRRKELNALGRFINAPADRRFHKAIKALATLENSTQICIVKFAHDHTPAC
jgi:hypothetical protein